MAAASKGKSPLACKYYVSGACNRGRDCPFTHDRSAAVETVCRYYLAGSCQYGQRCRYDHVRPKETPPKPRAEAVMAKIVERNERVKVPSSSLRPDAPVFVPSFSGTTPTPRPLPSYATATSGQEPKKETPKDKICPYNITGQCYLDEEKCPFMHGSACDLCERLVIHPNRTDLNREHRAECIAEHEAEMEAAFAEQASASKACGICMDVVLEKPEKSDQRFGILTNCRHCFCLRCIRQWRGQGKPDEEPLEAGLDKRFVRRCPECRVDSEFVVPSSFWVDGGPEKAALIATYRDRLQAIPCKYHKAAAMSKDAECPFGNKCFYRHANPDGTLAEGEDPKDALSSDDERDFMERMYTDYGLATGQMFHGDTDEEEGMSFEDILFHMLQVDMLTRQD